MKTKTGVTVALFLTLLVCPARGEPPDSPAGAAHFTIVQRQHLELLNSTFRQLCRVRTRAAKDLPVEWAWMASRVQSASERDASLKLKEDLLQSQFGSRAKNDRLDQLIGARRTQIVEVLGQLARVAPPPWVGSGLFSVSTTTVPAPEIPRTPAKVRAYLRTVPLRSVEDLFVATSQIPRKELPASAR